ncbi:hypothetical protein JNB_16013 [Janibacter sp. HTCC2649]|uniref:hypothetical protein n=1 Tax=Janibacter sp. HTCC2649 TaxID=313589 RepID=UPI0000671ABC|nr:hypothetical protein [Janibacter sp. HTCC2649]EAP98485.1 hypothetical protein JNB_16013 [Janibacter sp. HTCC2649]
MQAELFVTLWYLTMHVTVAALIVLAMPYSSPVWGGRAAKASWIGVVVTLPLNVSGNLPMPYQAPMALLGQSVVVLAVTGLGSSMSRTPSPGAVRQATLAPRRLFVARVPRQRLAAIVASTIALAAVVFGGLTATGTTLVRTHAGASGAASDYPGWSGGGPFLVAAAFLLILTWWALRQIEDRPRTDEPTDTVLRVRDASRVLRATTFAMSLSGAIFLFYIASRMNEATQKLRIASEFAPRSPWDPYQWLAFGLYVPAVALILAALFALGGSISSRETLASLGRSSVDTRHGDTVQAGTTP